MTAAPMSEGELRNFINHAEMVGENGDPSITTGDLARISRELLALRAPRKEQALGVVVEDASADHGPGIRWNGTPPPSGTPLYASPNGGREEREAFSAEMVAGVLAHTWANELQMDFPLYPGEARQLAVAVVKALRAQPHVEGKLE